MDALIVDAVRTPRGKGRDGGALSGVRPAHLLAHLVRALGDRHGLDGADDLIAGCSTQSGEQGTNVARLAALLAGFDRLSASTVSRFCASGLDAIATGAAQVLTPFASVVFAGGVESMSRAPMFSDRGAWFADPEIAEATGFVHMAVSADLLATRAGFTKEQLDAYAVESHRRARRARDEGWNRCVVPVGEVRDDELIRELTADDLAQLEPAFGALYDEDARRRIARWFPGVDVRPLHSVRASPGLADAASLVLLASPDAPLASKARARVASWAHVTAAAPMSLAGNVDAAREAVRRAGWSIADVDLFEINESFAAVPLHFAATLGVDLDRVDVHGGAIAMGHPLGATGGILIATLLDALERTDGRRGVAAVCGAAGLASAIAIERVSPGR